MQMIGFYGILSLLNQDVVANKVKYRFTFQSQKCTVISYLDIQDGCCLLKSSFCEEFTSNGQLIKTQNICKQSLHSGLNSRTVRNVMIFWCLRASDDLESLSDMWVYQNGTHKLKFSLWSSDQSWQIAK